MPGLKKGIVFAKYGDLAASTRQRFMQFHGDLAREGIEIEILPFLPNEYLRRTFAGRDYPLADTLRCYRTRLARILHRPKPAFLWIQYDALPFVPYAVEAAFMPSGVPRVYDFDDAIFHQYEMHPNPVMRRLIGRKFEPMLRSAALTLSGNAYLNDYASRFCRHAEIVPTVLDTEVFVPAPPRPDHDRPVTIGWIGSPSTWGYMRPIIPALEELGRTMNVRIRVVGAGPQATTPSSFEFLEWSQADEIAMIQGMDIGIMPLPDEPWARGKCGYKLIQYMACGIPTVASPVGVNREIVQHGVTGFHARDPAEWLVALRRLVASLDDRRTMGAAGRARAETDYSRQAHGPRLAGLIRGVLDGGSR
jgi:glycosyltransferase involved in cell wall biosynthesis